MIRPVLRVQRRVRREIEKSHPLDRDRFAVGDLVGIFDHRPELQQTDALVLEHPPRGHIKDRTSLEAPDHERAERHERHPDNTCEEAHRHVECAFP